MKYIFILFLFISWSNQDIDDHGITRQVTTRKVSSLDLSKKYLNEELLVLCKRNGFKNVKIIKEQNLKDSQYEEYISHGVGECLK